MVEKQLVGVAAFAATRPDLFVDGYFSQLMMLGQRPDHGYPKNHLPDVPAAAEMEVEFGSLA